MFKLVWGSLNRILLELIIFHLYIILSYFLDDEISKKIQGKDFHDLIIMVKIIQKLLKYDCGFNIRLFLSRNFILYTQTLKIY